MMNLLINIKAVCFSSHVLLGVLLGLLLLEKWKTLKCSFLEFYICKIKKMEALNKKNSYCSVFGHVTLNLVSKLCLKQYHIGSGNILQSSIDYVLMS